MSKSGSVGAGAGELVRERERRCGSGSLGAREGA